VLVSGRGGSCLRMVRVALGEKREWRVGISVVLMESKKVVMRDEMARASGLRGFEAVILVGLDVSSGSVARELFGYTSSCLIETLVGKPG